MPTGAASPRRSAGLRPGANRSQNDIFRLAWTDRFQFREFLPMKKPMTLRRIVVNAMVLMMAAGNAAGASTEPCPPPLNRALRLLMVTTATMETHQARLKFFKRSSITNAWQPQGESE